MSSIKKPFDFDLTSTTHCFSESQGDKIQTPVRLLAVGVRSFSPSFVSSCFVPVCSSSSVTGSVFWLYHTTCVLWSLSKLLTPDLFASLYQRSQRLGLRPQPPDLLIPSFGSLDLGVRVDLNRLHHSSPLSPTTRLTVQHCNSFNLETKSIHHPHLQPLSLTHLHLLPCWSWSRRVSRLRYITGSPKTLQRQP
ncbi:hypothetical protein YC2023_094896 [Brassica napus]